jgi:hypothetical protein
MVKDPLRNWMVWGVMLVALLTVGCGAGLRFEREAVLGATKDAKTKSARVSLTFEVWDGDKQLTNLSKESFSVIEDGQPATSESISEAATKERRVPVLLLLDTSLSMYQANAVGALKAAAKRFVETLSKNGFDVTVFRFASQIKKVDSIDAIPDKFNEEGGERWTSLYAAVAQGMADREDAILVVFSDGADNYSQNHGVSGLGQVEPHVLAPEMGGNGSMRVAHTIGFGNVRSERDRQGIAGGDALQRLGANGSFHFAEQSGALDTVFQDVANRIRNVYVFDYFSPNLSGTHAVVLEVRIGDRVVQSRPMQFTVSDRVAAAGPGSVLGAPLELNDAQAREIMEFLERAPVLVEACAKGLRCEEFFDQFEALLGRLPPEARAEFQSARVLGGELESLQRGCTPARPLICRVVKNLRAASATGGATSTKSPPPGTSFIGAGVAPNAGGGVAITGTLPGSPAEAAGLKVGDAVTNVDGEAVSDPVGFTSIVSSRPVGSIIKLSVERGDETLEIQVMTVKRPGK